MRHYDSASRRCLLRLHADDIVHLRHIERHVTYYHTPYAAISTPHTAIKRHITLHLRRHIVYSYDTLTLRRRYLVSCQRRAT